MVVVGDNTSILAVVASTLSVVCDGVTVEDRDGLDVDGGCC